MASFAMFDNVLLQLNQIFGRLDAGEDVSEGGKGGKGVQLPSPV